mmetsp:Transcript_17520/g.34887  ORF Transcript_17520/g.34887 Transcript_17520/m.34887 type:complete len:266 (+) Transcript_17520:144-941(+)
MASSGSGYDLSSSTFSPDGRIFQVEYAAKAVENGGTTLGIRCSDGILLCSEKPLVAGRMAVPASGRRVHALSSYAGAAVTGFLPDGRQVVARGREEAAGYLDSFGAPIPPAVLAERLGSYVHYFTLHGALRPFGASTLMAGYDTAEKRHSLHMVDPSGMSYEYYAAAAGRGRQSAKTELEKLPLQPGGAGVTLERGLVILAKILHMLFEEGRDKPFVIEMGWMGVRTGWKFSAVPDGLVKAAEVEAKKELEDEEGEEDEGEEMEE